MKEIRIKRKKEKEKKPKKYKEKDSKKEGGREIKRELGRRTILCVWREGERERERGGRRAGEGQ